MEFEQLIIDGYNLLHQDPELVDCLNDLQAARQRLVRRVEMAAPEMARRITVVFDGQQGGRDASFDAPHLEVLFSRSGRTADGEIERMVASSPRPQAIGVVTSDRIEAQIVSSSGATVISCLDFLSRCKAIVPASRRKSLPPKPHTLGDFFPKSGE